jgi:hypothetical protein
VNVNYANVYLSIVGNYSLRYYVSDPSGNIDSSVTRLYRVVDIIPPSINLIGKDTVIIDAKTLSVVPEPGYIITDNYYPASALIVNPNYAVVNLNVFGNYTAIMFPILRET